MKLGAFLAQCNRLQQGRMFKIVATCVVAVLAVAGTIAYSVAVNVPSANMVTPEAAPAPEAGADAAGQPAAKDNVADKTAEIINGILAAKQDATSVAVGIALVAGLAIGVIWLGLGLSYLALGVGAALVLLAVRLVGVGMGAATMLVGVMALTASFAALIRLVGLALSGPWPVLAIARNVLNEAVRMKISLVFIVMLVFGLAALPLLMEVNQPLRYRVQSFLQYGTGGAFWLIAVLVLLFSASTVTFEQRDKTIWQTMTKPVAAWEYVLGKWLGVVALSGVLLGVSCSGVFLFTEYLRNQPAAGETEAYVADAEGAAMSEDRYILETQVLTARESREADPLELDVEAFRKNVEDRLREELKQLRDSGQTFTPEQEEEIRGKILKDLPKQAQIAYRSIEPGGEEDYKFSGLEEARRSNSPLNLRFKVNAGSNAPDALFHVSFAIQNEGIREMECPLGQIMRLQPPMLPTDIDEHGVLRMRIFNYGVQSGKTNAETITFPPEGLEVSYEAGGYRANFAKVVGVLWVKLGFLAMLSIAASTFLSFPVACLVAFTTFLAAEGSGFILQSLESYQTETREGQAIIFNTVVDRIASTVGHLFKVYADLRPTGRLVDGLMLTWKDVSMGVAVLGLCTALLYVLGVIVFRRRELATYSGQ